MSGKVPNAVSQPGLLLLTSSQIAARSAGRDVLKIRYDVTEPNVITGDVPYNLLGD